MPAGSRTDLAGRAQEGRGKAPSGITESERAAWQRMLETVHGCRREDGLFSWQLECARGPLDTSASGMIYYALQLLAERDDGQGGPVSPFAGEDLDLAAQSLLAQTDAGGRVLQSSAECVDFAQYVQQYGTYPWGQGAVLAFLAAWQRGRRGSADKRSGAENDYC